MNSIIDFETTVGGKKGTIRISDTVGACGESITVENVSDMKISPEILIGVLARYEPFVVYVRSNLGRIYPNRKDYALESLGEDSGTYNIWKYGEIKRLLNKGIPRLVGKFQEKGVIFIGSWELLVSALLNYNDFCIHVLGNISKSTINLKEFIVGDRELLLGNTGFVTGIEWARLHNTHGTRDWFCSIRNLEFPAEKELKDI